MNSSSVENEASTENIMSNDVETAFSYKIEWLLNKHMTQWECSKSMVEYLVKWKDYNNSYNVWYEVKDLSWMKNLIINYEWQTVTQHTWSTMSHLHTIITSVSQDIFRVELHTSLNMQCECWLCLMKNRLLWIS